MANKTAMRNGMGSCAQGNPRPPAIHPDFKIIKGLDGAPDRLGFVRSIARESVEPLQKATPHQAVTLAISEEKFSSVMVGPGEKARQSAGDRVWKPRMGADLRIDLGEGLRVRGGGVDAPQPQPQGILPRRPRDGRAHAEHHGADRDGRGQDR
jgi:hypothetical protein